MKRFPAAIGLGALVCLTLRCIGAITPTACTTEADCGADTTCQNGICVYKQGTGLGGEGVGGGDAGEPSDAGDAGDAGDAAPDAGDGG